MQNILSSVCYPKLEQIVLGECLISFGAEYAIFSLLSKNIKIKTYRIIILFVVVVVVYGGENQSITLRDKHRQKGKHL